MFSKVRDHSTWTVELVGRGAVTELFRAQEALLLDCIYSPHKYGEGEFPEARPGIPATFPLG